jgi:cytochrome P450
VAASPSERREPGNLLTRGRGTVGRAAPTFRSGSPPAVTVEMAGRQRPRIERTAAVLAWQMSQRGEADLVDDFALPLTYTVVCDLIGISPHDRKRLHDWTNEWRHFLRAGGRDERQCSARTAIYDHMSGLLADRLEYPQDDLCTGLALASKKGGLPAHEAIAAAARMLLNGYPKPTSLISNVLLGLLLDHDIYDLLTRRPRLIPMAVEGFLCVMFGNGRERCPGAPLARLEAQVAITAMLPHLSKLRLAVPAEELAWSDTRFGTPAALERCPVTWPRGR